MVDANSRRIFGALVSAAFVDGSIGEEEKQVLHRKATELDIPVMMFDDFITRGAQGKLRLVVPPGADQRERMLNDLIDIVCADANLEASEQHLIVRFANHIGVSSSDLRGRVRARMSRQSRERRRPEPPKEEFRIIEEEEPIPVAEVVEPPKPVKPRVKEKPIVVAEEAARAEPPPWKPGPVKMEPSSFAKEPELGIPPVTLQLIRQAVLFEKEKDARHYVERMMDCSGAEAEEIIRKLRTAYPALRPGSMRIKGKTAR
jgi:uncharacterized tellurite resistance protein B-like protein